MPTPAEAQALLASTLASLEPARQAAVSSGRNGGIFLVLTPIVGFLLLGGGTIGILWFMGNFVSRHSAALIAATLIFWAILGFAGYRTMNYFSSMAERAEADYRGLFRERVLEPVLRAAFPGHTTAATSPHSLNDYKDSLLFHTNHNRLLESCAFQGNAGGAAYRASVLRVAYHERFSYRSLAGSYDEASDHRRLQHFAGILIRIEAPVLAPVPIRLVSPEYHSSPNKYRTSRHPHVVRAQTGDPDFDAEFIYILPSDATPPHPVPPAPLRQLCRDLQSYFQRPVFLSFTRTATFVAVATGVSRLPMEGEAELKDPQLILPQELDLLTSVPGAIPIVTRAVAASRF